MNDEIDESSVFKCGGCESMDGLAGGRISGKRDLYDVEPVLGICTSTTRADPGGDTGGGGGGGGGKVEDDPPILAVDAVVEAAASPPSPPLPPTTTPKAISLQH